MLKNLRFLMITYPYPFHLYLHLPFFQAVFLWVKTASPLLMFTPTVFQAVYLWVKTAYTPLSLFDTLTRSNIVNVLLNLMNITKLLQWTYQDFQCKISIGKMTVKIDAFRTKWQSTTAINADPRESTVNQNPLMMRAKKTE